MCALTSFVISFSRRDEGEQRNKTLTPFRATRHTYRDGTVSAALDRQTLSLLCPPRGVWRTMVVPKADIIIWHETV